MEFIKILYFQYMLLFLPNLQVQTTILTQDRVKQIFLFVGKTAHFPPLQ